METTPGKLEIKDLYTEKPRPQIQKRGSNLFQKMSFLPPQKGLEIPGGGWEVSKAKNFKEMDEA